jgi:hypothetical protein
LISFYIGTTEDGLIVYDMSSLFEGQDRVYAMFEPVNLELDSLEFVIANQKLTLYVLTPLEQRNFTSTDFKVPTKWNCGYHLNPTRAMQPNSATSRT